MYCQLQKTKTIKLCRCSCKCKGYTSILVHREHVAVCALSDGTHRLSDRGSRSHWPILQVRSGDELKWKQRKSALFLLLLNHYWKKGAEDGTAIQKCTSLLAVAILCVCVFFLHRKWFFCKQRLQNRVTAQYFQSMKEPLPRHDHLHTYTNQP